MVDGVIFDYGSTLIQFDADFPSVRTSAHHALVCALAAEGISLQEDAFLERFCRKMVESDTRRNRDRLEVTAGEILAETLREEGIATLSPSRIKRVLRKMYAVFEEHWKPYPETHEALRQIKALRLRLAMVSNAADEADVRSLLKNHRLEALFSPVVISAAIGFRKPDARAFQPVLDAWKCDPGKIVMVGDQLGMDILGAQALGMRTIWIRTEEDAPSNREFRGKVTADAQVNTIGEVAAILAHWKEKT